MAYNAPADSARRYLAERVLQSEWIAAHDDVAYYFKAPIAFLEAEDSEAAEAALEIAVKYMDKGGSESKNGAYANIYPHYPWMWMCWAAVRLGKAPLADQLFTSIYTYAVPQTCAMLVTAPYSKGAACEADFFATAELLKVALLLGRQEVASLAATTLVAAVEANRDHMNAGQFYLRWEGQKPDAEGGEAPQPRDALILEEDPFHVLQGTPGQLYFMMAFPVMVLIELSDAVKDHQPDNAEKYRSTAMELLEYLKACTGIFESTMAHKFGVAAAMAQDVESARRIADFFVSLQREAGCFQEDPEAMDCIDQTAEITAWLYQIGRLLV